MIEQQIFWCKTYSFYEWFLVTITPLLPLQWNYEYKNNDNNYNTKKYKK